MYEIRTEIEITADASAIWSVLTDFDRYPEWNPFVREIRGDFTVGGELQVTLAQKGSKPMTVKPKLVAMDEERRFGWLGHLLVPHLFDGEHWYEIEPLESGSCRFKQYERFSGILLPFLRGMLDNKTKPSFEGMNRALKERVEARIDGVDSLGTEA